MQLHNKVSGRYKIEKVINAGTALEYKVPLTGWFDNLITNRGLDLFGVLFTGTPIYTDTCMVGSSNTAPAITDLAMVALLGSTTVKQSYTFSNSSAPNYYKRGVIVYRFPAGTGTGNISEVGVGINITSGNLFSRALVLDINGNPTTITKLSDEILDVTYEFRIYPVLTDVTGSITLTGNKGATYNYTGRVSGATKVMESYIGNPSNLIPASLGVVAYTGPIGDVTSIPTGTPSNGSGTVPAYVNGTYNTNFNMAFSVSQGNLAGGIKSIRLIGAQMDWQFEFNNAIAKTSSDTLSITGNISWGRY